MLSLENSCWKIKNKKSWVSIAILMYFMRMMECSMFPAHILSCNDVVIHDEICRLHQLVIFSWQLILCSEFINTTDYVLKVQVMATKQPNSCLFVSLNREHIVTKNELAPCPSHRKGVSYIRHVCCFAFIYISTQYGSFLFCMQ